jgi:hypothetical protein
MALIDHTYFTEDILIPGLENTDILEKVQAFIEHNEPVLLRDVLGYELWSALKTGLEAETPAQKWTDLVYGTEYTNYSGYKTIWPGLTGRFGQAGFPGGQPAVSTIKRYQYQVDRGDSEGTPGDGEYWTDPEDGDTELVDERLDGATKDQLRVSEGGYGDKLHAEYNLRTGGGIILLSGKKFNTNTAWFIDYQKTVQQDSEPPTDTYYSSLIANYIYCRWMKKEHTQSVRLGEVKPRLENADQYNSGHKIVSAWNQMSEWINAMYEYLEKNRETYPEWDKHSKAGMLRKFSKINQFGI